MGIDPINHHGGLRDRIASINMGEVKGEAVAIGKMWAIAAVVLLGLAVADIDYSSGNNKIAPPTPLPAYEQPTEQPMPRFGANEVTLCGDVPEGGTVSGTIKRINNNQWPPNQFNGLDIYFLFEHNGKRIVAPIREINATEGANVASAGDDVCISASGDRFQKQSTPTPPKK